MSPQTRAIIDHFASLAAEAGEAAAYKRDNVVIIPSFTIVPAKTDRGTSINQAASVVADSQEWLMLAAVMASHYPPVVGDEIVIGTKSWRLSRGGREGVYRSCDAMATMIRLFSKVSR